MKSRSPIWAPSTSPACCKRGRHNQPCPPPAREAGNLCGMDLTEISRRLENLIRIGTVCDVDHTAVRCRVKSGKLETEWLRWHTPRAGATLTWDPPTIGEQAMVLSPSGDLGNGMVFYGFNCDAHPAPSNSPDKHVVRLPDGATFSYDHAASSLDITGIATCRIEASESITHDTPLTHMTGKLVVEDLLTYGNGIAGTGGENNNTITGDFKHTGGALSSNGIILDKHHHKDVLSGGDESGDPV